MEFGFNEDQLAMAEAAERLFTDLCSDDKIKSLSNLRAASTMHRELWSQLAGLGILGIPFEEQFGGLGLTMIELCLVLEQQGRTVAPVPLISTVVEAGMTVQAGANPELKDALLPGIVGGEAILSVANPYRGRQPSQVLKLEPKGSNLSASGRSGFASYAGLADGFVLNAKLEDQCVIFYLPKGTPGLTVIEQVAINDEPAGYLQFDDVVIGEADIIARGQDAIELLKAQKSRLWVAQAALQTGALQEGLKRAAEYVSERKQFGRVLGSFQAVSQQAADAYMEIESLRSAYWRALDDIEHGVEFYHSAAVAKYWVGTAGHAAAHTFLHLHGGIGQDLDYPIHRYFLWAKQSERYGGTPDKIASLVGSSLVRNLDELIGAS